MSLPPARISPSIRSRTSSGSSLELRVGRDHQRQPAGALDRCDVVERRAAPPRWSHTPHAALDQAVQMPITGLAIGLEAIHGSPQQRPLHLAARGLRQLGREVDDPGVLVRRGLLAHVLLELGREVVAGVEPVAQHDDRADDRAALVVGRRDDGRLGDRRVRDERRLDLERPDPVPRGDDHVVGAPLEVQVAVLVLADAVAGVPGPIVGRGLALEVADEEGGIGLRVGEHQLAVDHLELDARAAGGPSSPAAPARRPGCRSAGRSRSGRSRRGSRSRAPPRTRGSPRG